MTAETLSRLMVGNLHTTKLPTPVASRILADSGKNLDAIFQLNDIFTQVHMLHRQKCGLDDALPFNASKHAHDFEAQVAKLCAEFLERLEVTP